MKRLLLTGALLLAVAASNRSLAADLPLKAPEPVPVWGWTEFYFGLNIGEADGHTSWCTDAAIANCATPGVTPTDVASLSPMGTVVGGQFGYRWRPSITWSSASRECWRGCQ